MKKGFFTSVAFHAIILIAVMIGLPKVKPFEIPPSEAITVDISTIADDTKLKAQAKVADKPAPKPAPKASDAPDKTKPPEKVAPEKKLAKPEPDPPPKPEPKPEAKPEPDPPPEPEKAEPPPDQDALNNLLEADQKVIDDKRKADELKKKADEKKKKAEEAKKLAEQKKAEDAKKLEADKKKRKLDMAQLDQLLNKENDEAAATLEKKSTSGDPQKAEQDVQGESDKLQANINSQIGSMIENCWITPPGARDRGVTVTLIWHVDRSGKLTDTPQVYGGEDVNAQGVQNNTPTNTFYGAVMRAATSGIYGCDFSRLPKKYYDKWSEMSYTFDPRTPQ